MDRSPRTSSILDELRQIQHEVRRARTLDDLRFYFDRVQMLRRTHSDDFDLQIAISEVQEQVVEKGRQLREAAGSAQQEQSDSGARLVRHPAPVDKADEVAGETAETPGVQKLDQKTWQRATYLALFFALILFFAFFYLVQTARRLNFPQNTSTQPAATEKSKDSNATATDTAATQKAEAAAGKPTVRIYTDLIPATLSIDDKEPQELKDGEAILDNLEPGRHSVKVAGKYSNAAVSFDVSERGAPRVVGQPVASNVMAVAVSTDDGKGTLITNAAQPVVLLDGKAASAADTNGVALSELGNTDHDLQVTENKDRQRFVLTYTPAPTLTLYVKADPNAGTVVVSAGQDDVDVYVNDKLYRKRTDRGQVRIPLKVGEYTVRLHKAGFMDPPAQTVQVAKAEESPLDFKMEPVPEIATLQVKGALPGTMVYLDKNVAAVIGNDGVANISNVKPGDHSIELRRDQALPKKFDRNFRTGEVVVLSGPDVALERAVVDNKQPAVPAPANASGNAPEENNSVAAANTVSVEGQQVRKGGGFVPYNTPKSPGRFSFQAQSRKSGLFKRGKVQWYAGYVDGDNYILYTLDGKRATVKQVKDGKSNDIGKIPFEFDNDEWIQVDMSVKPGSVITRIKTPAGAWHEMPAVSGETRDLTQDKVGMYIPGSDEVAIANFHFTGR